MSGRPVTTHTQPLQAVQMMRERGMSQAELLRTLAAAGLHLTPTAISRYLTHGRVSAFDSDAVSRVICTTLGSDTACQPIQRESAPITVEPAMISPHARTHFRLARDPFVNDVREHSDVFLGPSQQYVLESMYYAAKHGGFLAVVGESGAGKSVLRRALLDRLERQGERVVVVQPRTTDKRKLTVEHISHAIVTSLSQETPRSSREALAAQIERLLVGSAKSGNAHVLLIEEAHDLNTQTLKSLKRFWELEMGFRRLLGVVLVGQQELERSLSERYNYEAREVIRRCEIAHLTPLNDVVQLEQYLRHKFSRAGIEFDQLFAGDVVPAIRQRLTQRTAKGVESQLYPLVVGNLVSHAINEAAANGDSRVTGELVLAS